MFEDSSTARTRSQPLAPGNPVIATCAADPHVAIVGDRYWMYPTGASVAETSPEKHGFEAWSSRDLQNWEHEGAVLRFSEVTWARELGEAWAPCLAERNGRYYFYFCAQSRIGVAVADSPRGPFVEALGKPLIAFRDDLSAIDPMVFLDDDGQAYLYWGAVPASWLYRKVEPILAHLSVQKLAPDMVTLQGEEVPTAFTPAPPHGNGLNGYGPHIEASHVLKRRGTYYLMWSQGNWTSVSDEDAYHVRVARAQTPLGPWQVQPEPVLQSRRDLEIIGPGHHSVVNVPGSDEWWCVYHAHKGDADRRICVDFLRFNADGTLAPIVPAREGPPPRPLRLGLKLRDFGPFVPGQPIYFEVLASEELANVSLFAGQTCIAQSAATPSASCWLNAPLGFHQVHARGTTRDGETVCSSFVPFDVV